MLFGYERGGTECVLRSLKHGVIAEFFFQYVNSPSMAFLGMVIYAPDLFGHFVVFLSEWPHLEVVLGCPLLVCLDSGE